MYSKETIDRINYLFDVLRDRYAQNSAETINLKSPYSDEVNQHIRSLEELKIYTENHLKEDYVTRKSLIMNIDPFYTNPSGDSNLSLMKSGKAPFDPITKQRIELHHIGQSYNSPFAELPRIVHVGTENYSILHLTNIESWRLNRQLVNTYNAEASLYWKTRGEGFG